MTTAWTKENLVVMLDDFNNTWVVKTKPLTYLQAVRFVLAKRWNNAMDKGTVKIMTVEQFNKLQGA